MGVVDDRACGRCGREARRSAARVAQGAGAQPAVAQRQLVQIARALLDEHRLVIFDEPTAVLTGEEVETPARHHPAAEGTGRRGALHQPPAG